ncbi:MAG: hypothetical protein H7327_00145 [Herminiimonas sp.]|nr:hypothetical protein [Herminiimonas sp.]
MIDFDAKLHSANDPSKNPQFAISSGPKVFPLAKPAHRTEIRQPFAVALLKSRFREPFPSAKHRL